MVSMVSLTAGGGFGKFLISTISFFVMVFKALIASLYAGMATANSFSHSSLMAWALSASSVHLASSTSQLARLLSASSYYYVRSIIIAAVSSAACLSFGCRASNSACIVATDEAVLRSFSRPTSYRLSYRRSDIRLFSSKPVNVLMSSRYDVGVT